MQKDGEPPVTRPTPSAVDGSATDPARPGRRVLLFGSYDETLHPRVAVLREGMADTGNVVDILNVPLGMSTADKVSAASSLLGTLRLLVAVARSWSRLWRAGRRLPDPDVVVVGYMGHFDVHLAARLWPRSTLVLDHLVGLADTARDRGLASGVKYRLLDRLDRMALGRADIVVVDTAEQREGLPRSVHDRAVVVPVGATAEWFAHGPSRSRDLDPGPLRVCFVGLFTPLHGAEVIGRAIALLVDDDRFEFTMVGNGQDRDATRAAAERASVRWIDWVPSAELPELVASQDVCLGIFGTTDKAGRVVPTKVYQGLAAGNIVVTSDTDAQRRALGDAAEYVPAGDPIALAERLVAIAERRSSKPDDHERVAAAAEKFTPERVVRPLTERLEAQEHMINDQSGGRTQRHRMSAGPALPANAWLRFDLLRPTLESTDVHSVLEIGPGRGAIAARFVASGRDYTGVETSAAARAATGQLLDDIRGGRHRLLGSIDDLEPDPRFDMLCAFEVLEHIEDDTAALASWVRHLGPGATVLLSVPAWPDRFSTHDVEVGHLRRYTPDQLRAVAEASGLVDVDVRVYGFPLGLLLEWARNRMAERTQRGADVDSESAAERTARSGSWRQPPRWANTVFRVGTWPFRIVQRRFPGRGTGLVLRGRVPATSAHDLHGGSAR